MKKKETKIEAKSIVPKPADQVSRQLWQYAAIVLVILVFAGIRIRLRDLPLERDEGEYAYSGQLILQGVPPYQLAYNMKLPGTYLAYSAILSVFGQSPAGIHIGLLIVNAATTFLIFLLTMRLFGGVAGVVAGSSYALLSISPSVLGLAGHATHFVVLPAVAGLLLLLKAAESKKTLLYASSGLLLGLAFLMKQPGILFVIFGGLYLAWSEWNRPIPWRSLFIKIGAFAMGAALPYAVTCLILYRAGVFKKFWFWTVLYASQYGMSLNISNGLQNFWLAFPGIVSHSFLIWILAAAGLSAFQWDPSIRPQAVFVLGLLGFSFLAVCAGLYFREHYFILVLPAISILVGIGVSSGIEYFSKGDEIPAARYIPALVFLLGMTFSLYDQRAVFFQMDMVSACRSVYGPNPFPEAVVVSNYIRDHSAPASQVAVLGSEPEIYFYSGRRSATGYIYTYGLMETQKYATTMQKEMEGEVESARPDFLVFTSAPTDWAMTPTSDKSILFWAQKYVVNNYTLVGVADSYDRTGFRWGADALTYQPHSPFVVFVFKRNT
jgi:hypothetical protein